MELRFGIIGLGALGRIQARLCDDMDEVEVIGGADVSAEAREAFEALSGAPTYESYEQLLASLGDELDAVLITSPHTLHYDHATACLDQGLHVHLEKPMVTDITDAVDLVERDRESDSILQLGYQRHLHPGYREIARLIEAGRIGEVHMVNSYMGQRWITEQRGTWRANPELSGGGQLYDSGSHLLDTILWTTNAQPRSVAAVMDYQDADVDVNSALSAVLSGPERPVTASVGISGDGRGTSPEEGLYIWGTSGRIAYENRTLLIAEDDGQAYRTEITDDLSFETMTRRKLEAFVAAIRGERAVVATSEFGLQVTALTEAAYEAYETDSTVDVQALIERA